MTQSMVTGLSVVCVYNDVEVRQRCLDRSIDAYSGPIEVDYIPVDNTAHRFTSAGAALNFGARQARYETIIFAHQDVYLHSIDRLGRVATFLQDGRWGILGSNGVGTDGRSLGRLRDRVQLIGAPSATPAQVQTLDEVLFMILRERVLADPISDDTDLSWHAYAAEYSLRMCRQGLSVGAVDLAITHNSLTINLARLDAAHRRIGELYPDLLPINTTCGVVKSHESAWRRVPWLADNAWRLRWLQRSPLAYRIRRQFKAPVVLSDIRHDVDLLDFSENAPLHLLNLDTSGGFAAFAPGAIQFERLGKPVVSTVSPNVDHLCRTLDSVPRSASVLIPDLDLGTLDVLGDCDMDLPWIIGLQPQGAWLLGGATVRNLPEAWLHGRAVPFGQPAPSPFAQVTA